MPGVMEIKKSASAIAAASGLGMHPDGPADALRHILGLAALAAEYEGYPDAIIMAGVTMELGTLTIRVYMATEGYGDLAYSATMDIHNNEIGVALWLKHKDMDKVLDEALDIIGRGPLAAGSEGALSESGGARDDVRAMYKEGSLSPSMQAREARETAKEALKQHRETLIDSRPTPPPAQTSTPTPPPASSQPEPPKSQPVVPLHLILMDPDSPIPPGFAPLVVIGRELLEAGFPQDILGSLLESVSPHLTTTSALDDASQELLHDLTLAASEFERTLLFSERMPIGTGSDFINRDIDARIEKFIERQSRRRFKG